MKMFHAMFVVGLALTGIAREHSEAFLNAERNGARTRIKLRVVDDESNPVADANVRVFMGMNFRERGYWIAGSTDSNGMFLIDDKTTGNEIEIYLNQTGYYETTKKLCYIAMGAEHEVSGGNWQPYPNEVQIELRKIRNAIPLKSSGGVYHIPITNEWAAFDMEVNDWMPPYGKGKVPDVEFNFSWSGLEPLAWKEKHFGVRFPGSAFNGGYFNEVVEESQFPYSYSAKPDRTFCNMLADKACRNQKKSGMIGDASELVFRIRSVTNSVGKLESCLYGRFQRLDYGLERTGMGSLLMRYYYNSTPNDTNLEDEETARISRLKHAQRLKYESRCQKVKKR